MVGRKRPLENLVTMFENIYRGKRVWLSGHTGFKGAWMAEWLLKLGAKVHGYALPPDGTQPLFDGLALAARAESEFADIRDLATVRKSIREFKPDFVFHLAAQPLVRLSYEIPVETIETNVMGTVNVLEALRTLPSSCVAVVVTSDKCYENRETERPYEETDAMGGHDPYSASKGMAELAVSTYGRAYFEVSRNIKLSSARAGNVIGGGDYALDRIVPDMVRSRLSRKPLAVRNRGATRPWQHVLEPLSGYLSLGAYLAEPETLATAGGFNFGPSPEANRSVGELVDEFARCWPSSLADVTAEKTLHEAGRLNLSIDKAKRVLGWEPVFEFKDAIKLTAEWYQKKEAGVNMGELCRADIQYYALKASTSNVRWHR